MYSLNNHLNLQLKIWMFTLLLMIVLIILVGGLTRLTDSGLSITTWELFSGVLPPLTTKKWVEYFSLYKLIPEYSEQNFNMTLEEFKVIFWWEFIHRFLGRLIGLLFLVPLIYFTLKIGFKKTINFHLIFILICLQGFIGWYMVSSGLVDRVDVSHYRLALHLVLAFIILSLVFWNYLKYKKIELPSNKINTFLPLSFVILLFVQLIMGAFVSGMDAGKIYNTWPLMGNNYFPDDNLLINLFNFSSLNDPSLVQFIHRNLAYFILFFYIFILFKVYKNKLLGYFKILNIIGILLILQIVLGIFTLLSGAQMLISSMHQVSSIFLISSSVYFLFINTKTN